MSDTKELFTTSNTNHLYYYSSNSRNKEPNKIQNNITTTNNINNINFDKKINIESTKSLDNNNFADYHKLFLPNDPKFIDKMDKNDKYTIISDQNVLNKHYITKENIGKQYTQTNDDYNTKETKFAYATNTVNIENSLSANQNYGNMNEYEPKTMKNYPSINDHNQNELSDDRNNRSNDNIQKLDNQINKKQKDNMKNLTGLKFSSNKGMIINSSLDISRKNRSKIYNSHMNIANNQEICKITQLECNTSLSTRSDDVDMDNIKFQNKPTFLFLESPNNMNRITEEGQEKSSERQNINKQEESKLYVKGSRYEKYASFGQKKDASNIFPITPKKTSEQEDQFLTVYTQEISTLPNNDTYPDHMNFTPSKKQSNIIEEKVKNESRSPKNTRIKFELRSSNMQFIDGKLVMKNESTESLFKRIKNINTLLSTELTESTIPIKEILSGTSKHTDRSNIRQNQKTLEISIKPETPNKRASRDKKPSFFSHTDKDFFQKNPLGLTNGSLHKSFQPSVHCRTQTNQGSDIAIAPSYHHSSSIQKDLTSSTSLVQTSIKMNKSSVWNLKSKNVLNYSLKLPNRSISDSIANLNKTPVIEYCFKAHDGRIEKRMPQT